ncbi:MAG: hypothetical protein N3D75_03740 [Candidatus Aenigmarchaeota archaeon]|nr:hypothetical protein [Candidatus Aenigmarchaeota archaeon]
MNKNSFTLTLTAVLILLLVFSSNSKALEIEARTNKNIYFPNEVVTINTAINIGDELVPIEKINITIFGNGEQSSCEFDISNPVCQDSRFISVELSQLDQSYGYMHDNGNNWGYGYGFTSGIMTVKIRWLYDWPEGVYTLNVSAITKQDLFGRNPAYSTTLTFKGGQRFGNIAFICRTDQCNYGLEQSIIKFLTENGWVVNAKGYWSWTEQELLNYKLIACADELMSCRIDGSHPAFSAHKKGIPFLEIADHPYAQAAFRFGYTRSFIGTTTSDEFNAVHDEITHGFSNEKILIGSRFNAIPDHQLTSSVKILSTNGNANLFIAQPNRYAYIGWFNDKTFSELTDAGSIIANRVIHWLACGTTSCTPDKVDSQPPQVLSVYPKGSINTRRPVMVVTTDEKSYCRFSINQDKPFNEMEYAFSDNEPLHKYQINYEMANGTYYVYVKCRDMYGNEMSTYAYTFSINLPIYKDIAFICRDDSCNYGIENSMIKWIESRGWTVQSKGYWSWNEQELLNYKLIVCADELKACRIDGSHPAFSAHKKGIPFLEIADQPYAQASFRFGYTRSFVGMTRSESMYVTTADQITSGYSGSVNVITNAKFNVIPDYQLSSAVKDLADSGQHSSSTLFVSENYAYVGWFGASSAEKLTGDGNIILNRLLNWLVT